MFYCSRNCQIADWKAGHKSECKPYEVRENMKYSQLIFTRDLLTLFSTISRDPGDAQRQAWPIYGRLEGFKSWRGAFP